MTREEAAYWHGHAQGLADELRVAQQHFEHYAIDAVVLAVTRRIDL